LERLIDRRIEKSFLEDCFDEMKAEKGIDQETVGDVVLMKGLRLTMG